MNNKLKALILAGGRGKRLSEITPAKNKCMLELGGKPLINHSLDYAIDAGVDEIVIVVGYRAEDIINRFGVEYRGVGVRYVIQQEQKGLVHAIESAIDALDGADFMTFLGDEAIIGPNHRNALKYFYDNNLYAVCGVTKAIRRSEISKTYSIIEDDNNRVFRLIEKPRKPINDIQGTGNCIFRADILNYIEYVPISHQRGEKEFPDLIQCAIDEGEDVRSHIIGERYTNINTEEDIRLYNELLQEDEKA